LPYTVVGVMPALAGPIQRDADLWPIFQLQTPSRKGPFFFTVLGRLKADVAPPEAIEELRAINKRLFPIWQESYQDSRTSWSLEPLKGYVTGQSGATLSVLLAAAGFVLLVACANIANLMLVRASGRRSELALRAALGASKSRLLRLFLSESLLLSALGGLLGLALGSWLLQAIQSAAAAGLPRMEEASLSWTVLGFSAAISMLCGLLFGSLPAFQSNRADLALELRAAGNQSSSGPSQSRLRSSLVALEIALALPLLIGAGLMSNSLMRLVRVDPGFDTENLLTMHLYLPPSFSKGPEEVLAFWNQTLPRLTGLPGVEAAALSSSLPPDRVREHNNFDLEARPTPLGESQPVAPYMAVTPNYFETLGIPLLEGRLIEPGDRRDRPPVALVALDWAERFFPGESPLGQRFKSGGCSSCPWTTIVGLVGDVKYTGLQREEGAIYTPFQQDTYRGMYLTLRASQPAMQLERPVGQVLAAGAPDLAPSEVRSMEDRLSGATAHPRHLTALIGGFAALALLLVLIGIYGVLSRFVNQERKQIGIRLALGGTQGRLFWSVVGRGMRWAAAGLATGILAAFALSRFMDSLLFEVASTDLLTYASVTAALALVALLACALPARRAVRVDPVHVLRAE
ncbi:MAG: ADOP family duplicated permease, partial [Acidobacteriota bacterium]